MNKIFIMILLAIFSFPNHASTALQQKQKPVLGGQTVDKAKSGTSQWGCNPDTNPSCGHSPYDIPPDSDSLKMKK